MMQIDVQGSFLIGSAMAMLARHQLPHASERWVAKARTLALAFGGAVFAPTCLYIALRWTPWETMYLWDRATLPTHVLALFALGVTAASALGFQLTCSLIRAGRPRRALALNGLVAASLLLVPALGWERVLFVGTLEQFAAGARGNLLGSDLLPALVVVVLINGPLAWLVVRWLRRSNSQEA